MLFREEFQDSFYFKNLIYQKNNKGVRVTDKKKIKLREDDSIQIGQ